MAYHSSGLGGQAATFGEFLRMLRLRAHLRQRDLAIAVGYSESQICRLEQNRRLPDPAVLQARFLPVLQLDDAPELAERLLQLAQAAHGAPPGPAEAVPPGNLPTPLTTLINRVEELSSIAGMLGRADVRLLTLTGPPGIGKTRLSLQIAAQVQGGFPDGVFFVALAPLRSPALVLPTIARALGVAEGEGPVEAALGRAIRERQMLLVLDNFEHMVAAAPQLAVLLRGAPSLKALVTSRAALCLSGERLYSVPPLVLPDLQALPPLPELAQYPGVQLFVERVQAIRPEFQLGANNAAVVVEICTRLDGLPLAIELAAARSRLFAPRVLLEQLRGPSGSTALQFLTGGPRDLFAHQQTLRSTIDWSYRLLTAREQAVFDRLGVVSGGCTLEAATAVCGAALGPSGGMANAAAISEVLQALANQSLLQVEVSPDGAPRFLLLETIREYALEKLEHAGTLEPARRCHADFFCELARLAEQGLTSDHQDAWLDRIEADSSNLRAALEWCIAHDPAAGLRCAARLCLFWHGRGYLSEGRAWLARALEAGPAVEPTARAQALAVAGFLAYQQGDNAQALAHSQEGLALALALGDQRGAASALSNLGRVAFGQCDYARAAAIYGECLAIYRVLDDLPGIAMMLRNLGLVAKDGGDYARASALHEESLAICRALGDRRGAAYALLHLSIVAYWQGDYSRAVELAEQSREYHHEAGDRMGLAYALDQIAMSQHKCGQSEQAAPLLEQALVLFRGLGDKAGIALIQNDLGVVALALGRRAEAAAFQREGLELAVQLGDRRRAAFCLEGLAAAYPPTQARQAARLFGAAAALREALGTPLPPAEQAEFARWVAAVRASCDPAVWSADWATGRMLSLEEVCQGLEA